MSDHLPAPMTEMILDLMPEIQDPETPKRGERMDQLFTTPPPGYQDPGAGTPISPFMLPPQSMSGYSFGEHDPNDLSDLPDDIAEVFAKHEIGAINTYTPERLLENGETELATEYRGYRPSTEEIGTKFGPGKWRYKFSYRPKSWKRGDKQQHKVTPWFVLSEEAYRLKHQHYLAESETKHLDRLRFQGEQKRAILGGGDSMGNPLEMLGAVAGIVRTLAPVQAPQGGGEMATLLPILLKMQQDAAMQAQQQQQQSMTMMMGIMQAMTQSSQQMMQSFMQINAENTRAMIANTSKDGSTNSLLMFKEFSNFIKEGLNMRKLATTELLGDEDMDERENDGPEDKGLLSTIMQAIPVVLQNLPMLQAIPAVMRPTLVENKVAEVGGPQGTQAYQALREDPQFRVRAIAGFVQQYGADQVEEVLTSMGIKVTPQELSTGTAHGLRLRAESESLPEGGAPAQEPQD